MGQVSGLEQFFDSKYGVVGLNNGVMVKYKSTYLVSRNMNISIVNRISVSVGTPVNRKDMIIPGVTLEQLASSFGFSLDDYIVVSGTDDNVLNASSIIEVDCVLRLCHNVSVSGLLNGSFIIEHGTMFGKIHKLSEFFDSFHVIYNQSSPDDVVKNETLVLDDINVVISYASKQVIVISFDEKTTVTPDEIKDAISDIVELPNDEHLWIEVVSRDDGSFVISVTQTNTDRIDVGDTLTDCLNNKT